MHHRIAHLRCKKHVGVAFQPFVCEGKSGQSTSDGPQALKIWKGSSANYQFSNWHIPVMMAKTHIE